MMNNAFPVIFFEAFIGGISFEFVSPDAYMYATEQGDNLFLGQGDETEGKWYNAVEINGHDLISLVVFSAPVRIDMQTNQILVTVLGAEYVFVANNFDCPGTIGTIGVNSLHDDGSADSGFDADGGGSIRWNSSTMAFRLNDGNGARILTNQQSAIANASGVLADDTAKINAILAALRAHGLIAT